MAVLAEGLLAEDWGSDKTQADLPAARVQTRANTARLLCAALSRDAGEAVRSPGLAMALTVLWSRAHKFDAADGSWPDRDRFVACGAGANGLARALLRLSGHGDGAGDPVPAGAAADDGRNVSAAIGMAVAERVLAARFGKSLVDHRVWAACDAAGLARGGVQEAAAIAGQLKLDRLALLAEAGGPEDDARPRFAALGWAIKPVAADDPEEMEAAIGFALRSRKPTLVWCQPAEGEQATARVNANAREAWRRVGAKGAVARRAWLKRLARHAQRAEFERAQAGRLGDGLHETLGAMRQQLRAAPRAQPPAALCAEGLDRLAGSLPELVCARMEQFATVANAGAAGGRVIRCGNRPQGLAGCVNGMALHGGLLPVARARLADLADQLPSLRVAAAAGWRSVTIAVEAGGRVPELVGWLRAIANLAVFRPGCPAEAIECLELALRRGEGPSVIVASEGVLPTLRSEAGENRSARGGYVLAEAAATRQATLLASGAELGIAVEAQTRLAGQGIAAAVVSLPCWALFEAQDEAYRLAVLGEAPRYGVEAGMGGWHRWLDGAAIVDGAALDVAQAVARSLVSA